MKLRRVLLTSTLVPACAALAACGAPDTDDGSDSSFGTGGAFSAVGGTGTGGYVAGVGGTTTGVGGSVGVGGDVGAGGYVGVGGDFGTGGYVGVGGDSSSGGAIGTGGVVGTGGSGGPTFVEDEGADCTVGALPAAASLPVVAKVPDPFKKLDGNRIAAKSEWRCRRQEIKRQAEQYIYGAKPAPPDSVSGTVTNTSVTVNVTDNGKSVSFSVSVELPSGGSGPYGAVIGLQSPSAYLGYPLDKNLVKGEGVAVINYDPYVIGAEAGASRGSKKGKFYDLYGTQSTTGLLVAWAWGVSRIIDVIEQSGGTILRADGMGVSGCSRFGKGAFTIGAFDQRVALTMPIESGSGGVPIWRGLSGEAAQSASSAYGETYWLGDAFSSFTNSVTKLPLDTPAIVAMVAPRGLFIMDNPHIPNLGPRSAHVGALGGAEVFKALGAGANISYHSNVADGGHCNMRSEWSEPLKQNIRKFILKTGNQAGVITAASKATGNLADFRDWTTPTLN